MASANKRRVAIPPGDLMINKEVFKSGPRRFLKRTQSTFESEGTTDVTSGSTKMLDSKVNFVKNGTTVKHLQAAKKNQYPA
jgi:hypothetical protein